MKRAFDQLLEKCSAILLSIAIGAVYTYGIIVGIIILAILVMILGLKWALLLFMFLT